MGNFIKNIKRFLTEGWRKDGVHDRPKTFFKYFIYYPINWGWTLGSLLFIVIFIEGAIRYESPLLWVVISFPLIMLIYNFVDEYYAFQYYRLPDYLKPLEGESDNNFRANDSYWQRINKFEHDHNLKLTERHNNVIGRKISARTLQNIAKYLCSAVMLYIIIRVFITG